MAATMVGPRVARLAAHLVVLRAAKTGEKTDAKKAVSTAGS